jgi:steroid 5-alpha reductase family enzyme
MTLGALFLNSGALIIGLMVAVWLVNLALKNSSIVDIFWGLGFIGVAWLVNLQLRETYLSISAYDTVMSVWRSWLMTALVSIWGLRLALHILLRNWGQPEDFRYAAWRKENGPRWWWFSFFKVFLLQGVLLWFVSAPLVAGQYPHFGPTPHLLDILGVIVWLVGFCCEALGDWQLARFKADPTNKGKLLTSGLWRYTRHPNYFGDAAQWWGFYLIALAAGAWWTIFSPLLMTFLLMRISGVALLEKTLRQRPGYEAYMARTNAFFPGWPKQ